MGAGRSHTGRRFLFEEIGATVRTIVHHQTATLEEKEIAGGVLLEIRQTDMFEQVVQSAPGRGDIVTEVMDLHLAAFHRRLLEKSSSTRGNKGKEAPKDLISGILYNHKIKNGNETT